MAVRRRSRRLQTRRPRRRSRRLSRAGAERAARGRLRHFRQATILAVAITALLLLLFAPEQAGLAQSTAAGEPIAAPEAAATTPVDAEEAVTPKPKDAGEVLDAAGQEASNSARRLRNDVLTLLPKLLVVLVVLFCAWLITRLLRFVLRRISGSWEKAAAVRTIVAICVWLLALGISVTVLAGDVRALVGSLGLVGLALSWALQSPIESFTGWLLNSFRGYYRVGDRIAVGEILGEVYRIDFLNTTVWEIGSPGKETSYVKAEQPTGRLITFPNNEVLAGSIINFTRDFEWVWDEYELAIANESDLRYAIDVVHRIADEVLAENMAEPAKAYERILREARLERNVTHHPEVFVSTNDWATLLIIRYLVDARQRRVWKSRLITELTVRLSEPENARRILQVYPRRQLQSVDRHGRVIEEVDAG